MKDLIQVRDSLQKNIDLIDSLILKNTAVHPDIIRQVAVNAGHSDLDPKTGKYLTKGKMFAFDKKKQSTLLLPKLHQETVDYKIFYEGVWNRAIAKQVMTNLKLRNVPYVQIHHEYLDVHHTIRANRVNDIHKKTPICLLLELHSNSSRGGNARGFEVFTSPGETKSDHYATLLWNMVKKQFPNMVMRKDTSDGDVDKEAEFTMITKTWCSAILAEFGFFNNIEDIKFIMNPIVMENYSLLLSKVGEVAYQEYPKLRA